MRTSLPGVATGLAWTPVGGDILFIEASRIPGKGALILTGQLGDVMRESAQAALTLLKSKTAQLEIDSSIFEKSDIHVHLPAGATPKDGPSAGVAMFTALSSLVTGRTVRSDTAMTGEISLRGLVLPVGGIKEKVIAAARAGIKTVMLPARNRHDLDDIPQEVREQLRFEWLETVEEAAELALGSACTLASSNAIIDSVGAVLPLGTGRPATASWALAQLAAGSMPAVSRTAAARARRGKPSAGVVCMGRSFGDAMDCLCG